jgi:hypothetical protein
MWAQIVIRLVWNFNGLLFHKWHAPIDRVYAH